MIIPQSAIEANITDAASVGLNTAKKAVDTVATVTKAAISVKGTIGKSSITRLGKDSIMEFPTVASASIDTDDQIAIAKMLEKTYATLLVSIFSLRPSVSLNEYDNIAEYIKSIHSNTSLPTNLKKAQHFAKESLEGLHNNDEEFCLAEDEEPSGICVDGTITTAGRYGKDLALECWGIQAGAIDTDNLNEVVMPYRRSQYLLNERISMVEDVKVKKATEAAAIDDVLTNVQHKAMGVVNVGRNSTSMLNAKFNQARGKVGENGLVKNDRMISMEPTMINVSFYLHGSKANNGTGANFTQTVVLGVKSMVRNVTSEYMISNLVEGSKSSNPIFKLISWTRGEYKLVRDLIFNISEIKKKFKTKNRGEFDFLEMSKNRKEIDDVSKYAGNRVLPYMSLIVTDYEVAQAAQITGVDLHNAKNAKAFMDRYYLLAFGIYNTSTKTLEVLYDGADDFETMSMTYIQSTQKKDMDITKSLGNLASIR